MDEDTQDICEAGRLGVGQCREGGNGDRVRERVGEEGGERRQKRSSGGVESRERVSEGEK